MDKIKNLGIKIKINGKQICKAGFDVKSFVLTPMVSLVHKENSSEELALYIGGLDSEASEYVNWQNSYVALGDTITMEVIQTPFDQPIERNPVVESLESRLKRYHILKEELKEHIDKM